MGLRHQALHGMLANPDVSPFKVIEKPSEQQDWILIDHLIVTHTVRESDYRESEPEMSVARMASYFASWYVRERAHGRCVVLVKDGPGAQKPSVREERANRTVPGHLKFCKAHLAEIEYGTMKLLADVGMRDSFFLVTGAVGESRWAQTAGERASNLVSFHNERGGEGASPLTEPDHFKIETLHFPVVDLSYCDGKTYRPEGTPGVFLTAFGSPEDERLQGLLKACVECRETEADTLMVELANALTGSVTVCTGDTDLIAVLAASGRPGLTLRLDNKSYTEDRAMHESPFGELLVEPAVRRTANRAPGATDDWLSALCDLGSAEHHLLPNGAAERHADLGRLLESHGGEAFKLSVYEFLYRGGVRGSVYVAFLSAFFESDARSKLSELALESQKTYPPGTRSANTLRFAFTVLCGADDPKVLGAGNAPSSQLFGNAARSVERGSKRPREPEVDREGEAEPEIGSDPQKTKVKITAGLKRTAKAYADGAIPESTHARYLRLARSGRHLFLRAKARAQEDQSVRSKHLLFMALCGTDYSFTPVGLGIKRLLSGAIRNREKFSSWCAKLVTALWSQDGEDGGGSERSLEFRAMGEQLASLTGVPKSTSSKHWTGKKFEIMCRTLKYVCDLWTLKGPRIGPHYGFRVHDGVVRFIEEEDPESVS
uniref:Asteroid domain-containing protein n=1 Tax=Oryzias latipes TaxID=8090 RepID=A0A286P9Q6_ORYLA|nr:hypothetical protein ORF54-like [Oryzias latipes]